VAGKIVNLSELAEIYGLHRTTVKEWVKIGCPFVQEHDKSRRLDWQFNTAEVCKWREDRAKQLTEENLQGIQVGELKKRKLAAETALAELEAGKAKNTFVSVEDVERSWLNLASLVKGKFLALPAKVSPELAIAKDARELEAILRHEIRLTLNELATAETEILEDDENQGDTEVGCGSEGVSIIAGSPEGADDQPMG